MLLVQVMATVDGSDVIAVMVMVLDCTPQSKQAYVEIETHSEKTKGMTIADFRGQMGKPFNASILMDIDVAGFKAVVMKTYASTEGPRSKPGLNVSLD